MLLPILLPIKLLNGCYRRSIIMLMVCCWLFSSELHAQEKLNAIVMIEVTQQALKDVNTEHFNEAKQKFRLVKKWWYQNKSKVKSESQQLAQLFDHQIATISIAMVSENQTELANALLELTLLFGNYRDGLYTDNQGNTKINLASYIGQLHQLNTSLENRDYATATLQVKQLQQNWLAVEGYVVSVSGYVYDSTEQDLLLLGAYSQNSQQYDLLIPVVINMINYLTPLSDTHYTWFDAALIPLREGLEALLIVGALLASSKKSKNSQQAKRWVIAGSIAGVLLSLLIGSLVVCLFTVVSFGQNNQLINGWAGLIASIMMIYVFYYLHQNAQIQQRQSNLNTQTQQVLSQGKLFSFALLACLAIVREGLETVIFLIGFLGQLSIFELGIGIAAGFMTLAFLAWIMLYLGVRLPLRPFFLISSAIVFYLCFKFMGSSIHSLQLAGAIPATINPALLSASFLNIYPSWYSSIPQLFLLLGALTLILTQSLTQSNRSLEKL